MDETASYTADPVCGQVDTENPSEPLTTTWPPPAGKLLCTRFRQRHTWCALNETAESECGSRLARCRSTCSLWWSRFVRLRIPGAIDVPGDYEGDAQPCRVRSVGMGKHSIIAHCVERGCTHLGSTST